MALADKIKRHINSSQGKTRKEPLWKGPEVDGITFSLLSRFLSCRERFRLLVVEGWRPEDRFNHRLEYGNMWHVCEESYAGTVVQWSERLMLYARSLCKRYPTQQEEIDKWYNVCKLQFPMYVDYWSKHPDVKDRTPIFQEQVFDVPYDLPSGRTVRLRGKWDSVDLIGKGRGAGIYLQENKTKGDIQENQIKRQMTYDLQTMLYLVALSECQGSVATKQFGIPDSWNRVKDVNLAGVRYNVIRRPLSGGKGTIVQHKPTKSNPLGETRSQYYARLKTILEEDLSSHFMRWKVEISEGDILRFRRECLDPILEQLCKWWDAIKMCPTGEVALSEALTWRHPFGSVNWLDEGGSSDLDEYLATGSTVGLRQVEELFPELKE